MHIHVIEGHFYGTAKPGDYLEMHMCDGPSSAVPLTVIGNYKAKFIGVKSLDSTQQGVFSVLKNGEEIITISTMEREKNLTLNGVIYISNGDKIAIRMDRGIMDLPQIQLALEEL